MSLSFSSTPGRVADTGISQTSVPQVAQYTVRCVCVLGLGAAPGSGKPVSCSKLCLRLTVVRTP